MHIAHIAIVLAAGLMFTGCKKEAAEAPAEAPVPMEAVAPIEPMPAPVEAPIDAAPIDAVVDPNAPATGAEEDEDMPHAGGDRV